MEIKWKGGSQHKVEAQVAYEVIESVRKKSGGDVTADAVVKVAKAKTNPLHPEFVWDDSEAGNQYRLEQARRLIRSFVIVRGEIATERPQRVYEIVKLPQNEEDKPTRAKHTYRTLEQVMADPDTRAELLGRALRELITIRNRYKDLQELAVVMRAIDAVLESSL
jgi:hypothetical protein